MPRMEANLGELAQFPVGVRYRSNRSSGARENPPRAESRQAGHAPPKLPKRPLCKTCGDRVCVGNCKN
jgi:hypothetical protein